jgi:hypothetical protein
MEHDARNRERRPRGETRPQHNQRLGDRPTRRPELQEMQDRFA